MNDRLGGGRLEGYTAEKMMSESEAGRVFQQVTLDELGLIRQYIRETVLAAGCEAALLDELVVAVNEALANIVRHSYKEQPGSIELVVSCSQEAISVTLFDHGPQFDPTAAPGTDTTLPLGQRPFGGLGIPMMRDFCDELNYRRDSEGRNELTLLKRLRVDKPPPA
jgi:anti-sigma regulatory factor (Ser/Thr protein kinase)